jgi:large subunit ribosomal protein L6
MVKIPQGVNVSIEGSTVSVQGQKGKLSRNFNVKGIKIEQKDGSVKVSSVEPMIANTVEAHIKNMLVGVTEGYSRKMQMIYAHFPITLEVKGPFMAIKNFQGEKKPRRAKIVGATKIDVKGQEIFLSGISKDDVGQTVANIVIATKIRKRDSRVFQDGLYLVEE